MRTLLPRRRWKRAKVSAGTYTPARWPTCSEPLTYGQAVQTRIVSAMTRSIRSGTGWDVMRGADGAKRGAKRVFRGAGVAQSGAEPRPDSEYIGFERAKSALWGRGLLFDGAVVAGTGPPGLAGWRGVPVGEKFPTPRPPN